MISLWYDTKNNGAPYYIGTKGKIELNRRIGSIKPPSVIIRKPRSLSEKENFKANEWRNLLLYYLRYSLSGLLNKRYIEHFELLSAATYILSKETIHIDDVEKAKHMLARFVNEFEDLYGKSYNTLQ